MSRYRENYTIFKRGKYWYYRTYTIDGVRTTAKTTGCTLKSEAKLYIESIGMLLSITDESATVQADTINRIGDLIVELCHSAL